jgi:hypothetical protein
MKTPAYSVMRLMGIIWRRKVLEPFENRIIQYIIDSIGTLRTKIAEKNRKLEAEDSQLPIVSKTVQAIVDLSVNELTINYTWHSKFKSDGTYNELSNAIISASHDYYKNYEHLDTSLTASILEKDFNLLRKIFLPCTCIEIRKSIISVVQESLNKLYVPLFKIFKVEDSDHEPQPLLDSSFGKMLFDSQPAHSAKAKIKNFINYLISQNQTNDINYYNQLDKEKEEICKDSSQEDAEIEFKNSILDLKLTLTYEEATLFSLSKDIQTDIFMSIVSGMARFN